MMKSRQLSGKVTPWSNDEVQAFLVIIGDCNIQRQLDGATRNEKVFADVADQMASQAFYRTTHDALKPCLQEVFPSAERKWVYGNETHNVRSRVELFRAGQIEPVEKGQ
ncbi:hypothetical protein ILYODFUR_028835 [Ilyodon furcidens]|uniref:Myb/SANT-like DNA-binding domain-containing protein n=1 Tax=Ilyodon furcidens TaxID=33524 RepID=A0ABV0UDB1_9TELE